ncbi:MAG: type II toxin-antitoxin system YafQ family toxin [Rhodospirillales bacterium]|nr:type II toxin-antitoxin system YafQ family toxin [Rhodospirillales bacterium]
MRTIEQSNQFKKDLKRESKGRFRGYLRKNFTAIVKMWACDQPLDARFRDHALIGEWKEHRDCHIRPDLV